MNAVVESDLQSVAAEINTLHNEIEALHQEALNAAKASLPKAIRLGQLLTEQKASLGHGEWLPWFDKNVSFSRATGERYRRLYERREELQTKFSTMMNLADAYRLLNPPKPKKVEAPPTAADGYLPQLDFDFLPEVVVKASDPEEIEAADSEQITVVPDLPPELDPVETPGRYQNGNGKALILGGPRVTDAPTVIRTVSSTTSPKPDTEPPKLTTKRTADVKRISQSIHDAFNQSLSRPDQIRLMIDGVQRTLDEWKQRFGRTTSANTMEVAA